MKKTLLALCATLAMTAGAAIAQPVHGDMPPPPPFGEHMGPGGHLPKDITKDQFLKMAGEHFDAMDTDHNGTVTAAEREAFREKMQAKREERRERHAVREGRESREPHEPR